MIDTICVQFPIEIQKNFLAGWGYKKTNKKRGYSLIYSLVVQDQNRCGITYSYIPNTPQGFSLLNIEFSLPHLVYGDNLYMICDLKQAIDQANKLLPSIPGIPPLDLWNGVLIRLDLCYNYQVGDLVPFYIQALQSLKFPRRTTRPYTNQGVQYGNKQASLKYYDKERWYTSFKLPVNSDAHGVLRLEDTLRKQAIKSMTRRKYPTLHDITLELCLNRLEVGLDQLKLLNNSIGTYELTLHKLCETYGSDAGIYYFGLLTARTEYPSLDTLVGATKMHSRTMDRKLKKIISAGVPLTISRSKEPLPPLTIDRGEITEAVKQGASVIKYGVILKDHMNVNKNSLYKHINSHIYKSLKKSKAMTVSYTITRNNTNCIPSKAKFNVIHSKHSFRVMPGYSVKSVLSQPNGVCNA